MNFRRPFERARILSRSFVLTCCAVAFSSGVAFAQSGDSSRDARLLEFLAGKEPTSQAAPKAASSVKTAQATVPTFADSLDATRADATNSNPIRQARAAYPAAKPEPIRQVEYAKAPLQPSASQLALGGNPGALDSPYVDSCPDPKDMPSILDVPYKIIPKPGLFPENCPLPDEDYIRKAPTPITFTWKASSLCYKPLYFEDVQLERYGHYCHPLLQPFASRARFWLTIPVLPYLMGVNPPNECVYDLGYYRPGNCAPSMLQPIPLSLRGGLMEAGAIVGAAAIIP